MDDKAISVRLDARLVQAFRDLAKEEGRMVKGTIEIAMRQFLFSKMKHETPENHLEKWLKAKGRGDARKSPEQTKHATNRVATKGR